MKRNAHGLMRRAPRQAWALAAVALLAFAGAALAQTGGEFGLAWHSVDGGGGAIRSSTGQQLLPARLGRPAGGRGHPRRGRQLRGAGGLLGTGVRACGSPRTGRMRGDGRDDAGPGVGINDANMGYDIHRSTAPYFTPDLATKADVTTGHVWLDPAHCGNPATNYFYVVRATCIGAHADAARVGEFDFVLTPGQ